MAEKLAELQIELERGKVSNPAPDQTFSAASINSKGQTFSEFCETVGPEYSKKYDRPEMRHCRLRQGITSVNISSGRETADWTAATALMMCLNFQTERQCASMKQ